MLFNNHICKVQSQNFAQLQIDYMRKEIDKDNCSLLMSLREMFVANSDMCYRFACEAYMKFVGKRWCDEDDFQLRYEQIATYGVLLSSLVWGYDLAKGEMSLYTSSISGLEGMAKLGNLHGKKLHIAEELQQIQKALYESDRIRKTIHENDWKLVAVRLDPEIRGNMTVLTPTIPRSPISLQTHIIIPFSAYTKAIELLTNMLRQYILRIKSGDKVRDVTLNQQALTMIYGDVRTNQLMSYTPNYYLQKFYVPVVGASKYTPGVTNIDLTNVDKVEGKSLADVNMQEVNVNYDLSYEYFETIINALDSDMLCFLCQKLEIPYSSVAPPEDLCDSLVKYVSKMYSKDLYDFMKENDGIFLIENYGTARSRFGSEYLSVKKPETIKELESLLKTGVFKVMMMKRNGSFSTIRCTNNRKLIFRILGDKAMKFESVGVKLRWLKSTLENQKDITDAQLSSLISKFQLSNILHGSLTEVFRQIEQSLYEVEMNKTVVKQANLVLVRNLEAKEGYEYYKNLDLRWIAEIHKIGSVEND